MAKVRFGIVGTGNVVTLDGGHISCLNKIQDIAEITAVFGTNPEKNQIAMNRAAEGKQYPKLCSTYEELLAMDNVDAVLIATPNFTHTDYAVPAAQAGKHVFLEKPMEISLERCNEIIDACKVNDRRLQLGMVLRFTDFYQKMKKLCEDGTIGTPQMSWAHEFRQVFASQWKFDKSKSGGLLVEKGVHTFDLFNWFIGATPVAVNAFGGQNVVTEDKQIQVKDVLGNPITIQGSQILDNAWVTIEYDNGARACYGVYFFLPQGLIHPFGVMGTNGYMEGEFFDQNFRLVLDKEIKRYEFNEDTFSLRAGGPQQLTSFIDACTKGTPVLTPGETGKRALAISLAAEQSIIEKRRVLLSEVPGWADTVKA
jgi:predicted dehydrogenase